MERRFISRTGSTTSEFARPIAESGFFIHPLGDEVSNDEDSFHGRARELDELSALLATSRIVTIVGAADVGKSRLARAHLLGLGARDASESGVTTRGGTWVNLSEATRLDEVVVAVARSLDVDAPASSEAGIAALGAAIAGRGESVVVLDGVESAVDAVSLAVRKWSRLARHARWVITSRAATDLPDPSVLALEPLSIDDGVELFFARAKIDRTFETDRLAAALVRDVGASALAIELGAAFGRELGIVRVCERLRAAPNVLDALHSLLDPCSQRALAQCSVFRGGFDAEAAAQVIHVEERTPLEALRALVALRLVKGTGERFAMDRSVRLFAWTKLAELRQREATSARHAQFYVGQGLRLAWQIERTGSAQARARLATDYENLLVAHERALEDCTGSLHADRALGAALALDALLAPRGCASVRVLLLKRALHAAEARGADAVFSARARLARGDAYADLGRTRRALADYHHALRAIDRLGVDELRPAASLGLGRLRLSIGEVEAARKRIEVALEHARASDDGLWQGRALSLLADVWQALDDDARASTNYASAVERLDAEGDRLGAARALAKAARVAHDAGELVTAHRLYHRALAPLGECADRRGEGEVFAGLALVAREEGALDEARLFCARALDLHREIGDRRGEGSALAIHAMVAFGAADYAEARRAWSRAITLLRDSGDNVGLALALSGMATLEAAEGSLGSAHGALRWAAESLDVWRGSARVETCARAVVRIDRGHVDIAIALAAMRAGDVERSESFLRAAEERLCDAPWSSALTRLAMRRLHRALEHTPPSARIPISKGDAPPDALVVSARALWFRPPLGEKVVLGKWRVLQNILARLVERRERAPGELLVVEDLVAAGWPDQRILHEAGATRVYTAILTLRRLGLRGLLIRRDGGYFLDPDLPIVRVAENDSE